VVAATPLLYRDPDLRDFQEDSLGYLPRLDRMITRTTHPVLAISAGMPEFIQAEMVCAAALLVSRAAYTAIHGFDEQFFMYFEDDDLCKRLQQQGGTVGVFTKSRLIHLQGRSISVSTQRKQLYYISQDYYWQKHYGTALRLLMQLLRLPYRLLRGQ
jgi:GT2 family glycosyltransferase